jgi:hypothetical protein
MLANGFCRTCGCPDVEWLRPGTIARAEGVHTRTITRLIQSGRLHGDCFRGRFKISHAEWHKFRRMASSQYDPYVEGGLTG